MEQETYRRILEEALAISGSKLVLAVRLRIPVAMLEGWLAGTEPVPDSGFLDAVDVIAQASDAALAAARKAIAGRLASSETPREPARQPREK